ncbi:secreted protein containing TonB-dependent receptor, beta-barrel domain protein [mine drainage metagenome]|uniref:Secreted protein containing TonB-dependent receptor, beta-barrel domain protein n=1 Tax=mine drainage metagenome TaxID=410659 RepID=T1AG71_9ZZZZ
MSRLHRKPLYLSVSLALLAAGLLAPAAQAQDSKAPPQPTETLSRVEVKANAIKQHAIPMNSAFSASSISPITIAFASPGIDVQNLLQREPSINVRSPGPNGVRTSITFRAFNSGQFSETFDGVSINDPFNGGATNAASNRNAIPLTLNDIASVDIYRGINNPAVSSYNSLGGTINFVPREPSATPDASVTLGGGSFNTWFYGASAETGSVGGVRSLISIARQTSSGWVDNSGNRNTNLYYAGVLPYADGAGQLYAYALYNTNKGFTPHTVPLPLIQQYGYSYGWPLNYTNSYNKDHTGTYILGDKMQVNSVLSFDAKIYARNNNYDRTSYTNPAFIQSATQPYYLPNTPGNYAFWLPNPSYDPAASFGSDLAGNAYHTYLYGSSQFGFMPQFTLNLPDNLVTFGGDYSHTKLNSAEYWYGANPMPLVPGYNDAWNEYDTRDLGSAYVQDQISLLGGQVQVTPGLKYLYASTNDTDNVGFYYPISGSVSDSEHYTSPTLGINWRPMQDVSLYAAWGRSIKFPGIAAYYSNIGEFNNVTGQPVVVPLTGVKPEYVNDIEAGARYAAHGFEGAVDAYRENFTNTFISITNPTTGLSTTINGGSSRYEGIELQAQQRFDTDYGQFRLYGNWSENKANFTSSFNSTYAGTVLAGQPLAGVPKHLANLGVRWHMAGWRADVYAHYAGSQYLNQYNAGVPSSATIPGYTVVNFGIADTVDLGMGMLKNVELALHVDNVFNKRYYVYGYSDTTFNGTPFVRVLMQEPRAYYASATLKF